MLTRKFDRQNPIRSRLTFIVPTMPRILKRPILFFYIEKKVATLRVLKLPHECRVYIAIDLTSCWNIEPRMWERSARTFSTGDNVGIGKPAVWSRRMFEYICVVYILAVNGPSTSRQVIPPILAYTFIITSC